MTCFKYLFRERTSHAPGEQPDSEAWIKAQFAPHIRSVWQCLYCVDHNLLNSAVICQLVETGYTDDSVPLQYTTARLKPI